MSFRLHVIFMTSFSMVAGDVAGGGDATIHYSAEIVDLPASALNCSGLVAGGAPTLTKLGELTHHAAVGDTDGVIASFGGLPFSFLTRLSPGGVAAGQGESFSPAGAFQQHVIRFTPGAGFDIVATFPMPSGAFVIDDVNDNGQIAFDGPDDSLPDFPFTRPFFYSDETGLVNIGVLNDENHGVGYVEGMNASGTVVGEASYINEIGESRRHIFRWTVAGGIEDLHPGGELDQSYSSDINDAGQITGYAHFWGVGERAYRYADDTGFEFIHPENHPLGVDSTYGTMMNENGDIAGRYLHNSPEVAGGFQGFYYDDNDGWQPMGFLEVNGEPAFLPQLRGINNRGEVLLLYANSIFQSAAAVFRKDIGLVKLRDVVEGLPYPQLNFNPIALTEAGQILVVGDGFDEQGNLIADDFFALLTPDDYDPSACDDSTPGNDADLNRDGAVNAADLALLLGSWGACPGCDADLNGDRSVNAADLALLLGAWD